MIGLPILDVESTATIMLVYPLPSGRRCGPCPEIHVAEGKEQRRREELRANSDEDDFLEG